MNAGTYKSGDKTKKDKSQEKKLNNDPVEQTNYSDAFNMQVFAVLVLQMVQPATGGFVADISIR